MSIVSVEWRFLILSSLVGLERPYYELSSLLWTCEFWSTSSQKSPLAATVTGSPRNVATREARLSRREGFV